MAAEGFLRMRTTSVVGLSLLWLALAGAGIYETEPLLEAPAGPYRGTVVDEENKRPLENAVVLLIWQRPDPDFPRRRQTVAARDVTTNGAGQFVLDVTAVEQQFAKQCFAPRIAIFKAGYTPYPRQRQRNPPGFSSLQFVGAGAEVALTPVSDYEDQAMALNQFFEVLNSADVPAQQAPRSWQAVWDEFERLTPGMAPPPRPGGRP